MKISAGVDEVGRGSLAGPVIASSVILDYEIFGLDDSKKLSKTKREELYEIITKNCTFAIGSASNEEIDSMNIHNASLLAMKRSVENLSKQYSGLRTADIKLCCYLKMSMNTKEIARVTGLSVRAVENKRYRLRKKLDLNTEVSLDSFIHSFNSIVSS